MDNDNLVDYLKTTHPAAFEGWDEHQVSVEVTRRKGLSPMMIVTLNNKSDYKDSITGITLHRLFTINIDTEEVRVGRVGGAELRKEFTKYFYPKVFDNED